MSQALTLVVAVLASLPLLVALLLIGLSVWLLEFAKGQLGGLPLVGGSIWNVLDAIEGGILNTARGPVARAADLLTFAAQWVHSSVTELARAAFGVVQAVINDLQHNLGDTLGFLLMVVAGPVDTELPAWLKKLEDGVSKLPNEPAFRRNPLVTEFLRWVQRAVTIARLTPRFVRFAVWPLIGLLSLATLLLDLLAPLLRLPSRVDLIEANLFSARQDVLRLEGTVRELFTRWNQTDQAVGILQVDLERERAARVAMATQLEQALQGAERLQEARRLADKAQWSPLLTLTVLATLSASLIQTLRKTAECDPCAQIDQNLSDLPWRVAALEAYGEQN